MASALSTNEVTVLYNDVLVRSASSSEVSFWAAGLDAGSTNIAQLTNTFVTSSEALTFVDPIIRLYQAVFDRAPDAGGLAFWVGQERGGVSLTTIAQNFVASAEFTRDYGASPNPTAFIDTLYLNVLGRAADSGGLSYWLGVLGTPTVASETTVVLGFVNSAEFINDTQSSINAWLTAAANSAEAGTTASTLGTATYASTLPGAIFTLTTGVDSGSAFAATLPNAVFNGTLATTGATLNSFDSLTGLAGGTATLEIAGSTVGGDLLPPLLTLTNIPNIVLETLTNAGGTNGIFDVSGFTSVTNLSVRSVGTLGDKIKASATQNVTDVSAGTGNAVTITGGLADTVSAIGGITITGAAGAVTASDTATTGTGTSVTVQGGTSVTVTTSDSGGVAIGTVAGGAANPTGAVIVTDTGGGPLTLTTDTIFGGTTVNVTAIGSIAITGPTGAVTASDTATTATSVVVKGGTSVTVTTTGSGGVAVGAGAGGASDPTGTVMVTDNGGGVDTVYGGTSVNVTATGLAGNTVTIGGLAANNPSGAVTVTENGVGTVFVGGGTSVAVTTESSTTIGTTTAGAAPTGALTIIDTNAGPNVDTLTSFGGTTVSITTSPIDYVSPTIGDIIVGQTGTGNLAVSGTALANPGADPSGSVTIIDSGAFLGTTYYGTASTSVFTNGGSTVSITGGGNTTTITDVETTAATGGPNVGKAIGTSSLTTVSVDGVSGAVNIASNALANLTVADSAASGNGREGVTAATVTDTSTHALSLTLNNDAAGTSVVDGTASSVTVHTSGASKDTVQLVVGNSGSASFLPATESITFSNSAALTLAASSVLGTAASITQTTITANGSAALNLGNLSIAGVANDLVSINASGASGAVTVTINGTETAFTGGSGANVVTLTNFVGATLNGGIGGTNTLILTNTVSNLGIAGAVFSAANNISNFETLGLSGASVSGSYNAAGATGLLVSGAIGGSATFTNAAAGTPLTITANPGAQVTESFVTGTSSTNTFSAVIGVDGAATAGGTGGLNANIADNIAGASGLKTVDIASLGTTVAGTSNNVTLSDEGVGVVTTIVITGDEALNLSYAPGTSSAVTTINASGASGAVDLVNLGGGNPSTVNYAAAGVAITGGSGLLTAAGSFGNAAAVDTITTGSGGGNIYVGDGVVGSGGSEIVALGASTAKSDTINVAAGQTVTVTGFTLSASSTVADKILNYTSHNFSTPALLVGIADTVGQTSGAAVTTGDSVNSVNVYYTSLNGAITLYAGAGSTNPLSSLGTAQLVAAVEDVLGSGSIAEFVTNGNTVVVGNTGSGDDVIQLSGVTGVSGFASATTGGAYTASTLLINGIGTVGGTATLATGATNTTLAFTNQDTSAILSGTLAGADTGTVTVTNMAQMGEIYISADSSASNYALGNLTVTQAGASGTNVLLLGFAGITGHSDVLGTVTLNGDATLDIATSAGTGVDTTSITTLTDNGNTLSSINIGGSNAFTLGAVNDTGLTSINASSATGTLAIGSGTALTQSSLTITAETSVGSTTISANGNALTVTQAAVATGTNATIDITSASGLGDTFNAGNGTLNVTAANGAGDHFLSTGTVNITSASGADDVFTITGTSAIAISGASGVGDSFSMGNGGTGITASGNGDTFSLGTGSNAILAAGTGDSITFALANANSNVVEVGTNATITLAAGDATHGTEVIVTGDLTGALSSGAFTMTTLVNAVDPNDSIVFDQSSTEAFTAANVNVTAAGTLAAALDIAAGKATVLNDVSATNGSIDWFQFGGNTYIVEANGAAHSGFAMGTTDIVVKLVGLVDLSSASFVGHDLTL